MAKTRIVCFTNNRPEVVATGVDSGNTTSMLPLMIMMAILLIATFPILKNVRFRCKVSRLAKILVAFHVFAIAFF
jgi:hypothetical protein